MTRRMDSGRTESVHPRFIVAAEKRGPWRRLGSRIVHRNPWYHIRRDRIVRPDGRPGAYYVVRTKGPSVFIVALDGRSRVCLLRIYRYPTNRDSWEVPGGNSEGQAPLVAARRELVEETGLDAQSWREAGVWQTVNGLSDELSYVFVAAGLRAVDGQRQREEGIRELRFVAWSVLARMVRIGELSDGQSIVALMKAALFLKRDFPGGAAR